MYAFTDLKRDKERQGYTGIAAAGTSCTAAAGSSSW